MSFNANAIHEIGLELRTLNMVEYNQAKVVVGIGYQTLASFTLESISPATIQHH